MLTDQPLVSLLVAMRNEAAHIEECIHSILNQDYHQEKIEVFIFDGQSDDDSRKIVEEVIAGKKNYHLLENPKRIQSAAWNLGIQLSHGDVISIVSGHSKLSSDYVSKAMETLLRTKADMVGGTVRAVLESLALPIYSELSLEQQEYVVHAIMDF